MKILSVIIIITYRKRFLLRGFKGFCSKVKDRRSDVLHLYMSAIVRHCTFMKLFFSKNIKLLNGLMHHRWLQMIKKNMLKEALDITIRT